MKTCRYCGKLGPDDSTSCPECGTAFDLPTEQPGPQSSGRRPPRPEAASIVLREYPNETAAQRAIDALRTARIEGYIATDDLGGLFPPLIASPFRLVVSSVHREAAAQVLAEAELVPVVQPQGAVGEPVKVRDDSSVRLLGVFLLGVIAGALVLLGYQTTRQQFSGTVQRDVNGDGRTDEWDTYQKGKHVRYATDNNEDERPDIWYTYKDGVITQWEEDINFDGKVDFWATCDDLGRTVESKFDADFNGQPETFGYYQFGRMREQHSVVPQSDLIWKKSFFTNGILREDLIDRDRDGKFDERILFDVHGIEVKKERVN